MEEDKQDGSNDNAAKKKTPRTGLDSVFKKYYSFGEKENKDGKKVPARVIGSKNDRKNIKSFLTNRLTNLVNAMKTCALHRGSHKVTDKDIATAIGIRNIPSEIFLVDKKETEYGKGRNKIKFTKWNLKSVDRLKKFANKKFKVSIK